MRYRFEAEPMTACGRLFIDGKQYGDPFIDGISVLYHDRETVELKGVATEGDEPFPFLLFRDAVREHFGGSTVRTVTWIRKRPGRPDKPVRMKIY